VSFEKRPGLGYDEPAPGRAGVLGVNEEPLFLVVLLPRFAAQRVERAPLVEV